MKLVVSMAGRLNLLSIVQLQKGRLSRQCGAYIRQDIRGKGIGCEGKGGCHGKVDITKDIKRKGNIKKDIRERDV